MGFGHRVCKNYDPRAQDHPRGLLPGAGEAGRQQQPLFELAMRLEEIASRTSTSWKKLYPNVDFYSGIICRTLGIPDSMFTVMFAIARTRQGASHWMGDAR